MAYTVAHSKDFPPKLIGFCQKHQLLPTDAIGLLQPIFDQPEKGAVVFAPFTHVRVAPVVVSSTTVEYLVYVLKEDSRVILLADLTDFDFVAEQRRLVMNPVAVFKLIRAATRILEWIDRLPS
jgi:hypothetical protein